MRLLPIALSAAAAVFAAAVAPVLATAPKRASTTVALRAEPADLARIALATSRPGEDAVTHHDVSDLMLHLQPADGIPLAAALLLDNVERLERGRARAMMEAQLIVASGGRLHVEEPARCTAWVGDAATCRMGCDGGTFLVVRTRESDRISLRLVIGETTPGEGALGPRLAACHRHDDDAETSLAPRRGPVAEVALTRDRGAGR